MCVNAALNGRVFDSRKGTLKRELQRPSVAILVLVIGLTVSSRAHGPTICVGSIHLEKESAELDLRVGTGLLHTRVDPDNDATVTPAEWNAASPLLKPLFQQGIQVKVDGKPVQARNLDVTLNDASEIVIKASYPLPADGGKIAASFPFLKEAPGIPPANVSMWKEGKIEVPPTLVFYGRWLEHELKSEPSLQLDPQWVRAVRDGTSGIVEQVVTLLMLGV